MANYCSVSIRLDFGSKDDCQLCFQWMDAAIKEGKEKGEGPVFADTGFGLASAYLDRVSEMELILEGEVKWAIPEDEFVVFMRKIVGAWSVEYMRADYDEPGYEVHGYWEYNDQDRLLVDHVATYTADTTVQL